MKQKLDSNILAVRLYEGEDIVSSLSSAFKSTGKPLGIVISGAGMLKDIRLGYFLGHGRYKENIFDRAREIVSLTGNLINASSKFFAHLHVSLADDDGRVVGGHLEEAKIHGTGEIFIYLTDIAVRREKEEETGLEGLKL